MTGTLTLDGVPVPLTHVYATAQPGFFDKKKEDIHVLLSSVALSDEERGDAFALIELARQGKVSAVEVVIDAEGSPIGGSLFAKGFGGMVSAAGMHEFARERLERSVIAGRLSVKEPHTFMGVTYQYDARFTAPIPRPPTADELAAALSSPPALAAGAYVAAVHAGQLPGLLATLTEGAGRRLSGGGCGRSTEAARRRHAGRQPRGGPRSPDGRQRPRFHRRPSGRGRHGHRIHGEGGHGRRRMAGGEVRRSALVLAAGLLCLRAQADDVAGPPTKPLTPGSVALLVEHGSEPATREVWAAALKDPRPEVRAAAARVINVSGAAALVDDLKRSLSLEEDLPAAEEEIRALSALGGNDATGAVAAAIERLGPPPIPKGGEKAGPDRSADVSPAPGRDKAAVAQAGGRLPGIAVDTLRTADGFPPGFVASVMKAEGCDPEKAAGLAGAQIAFGTDGRPITVSMLVAGPRAEPLGRPVACQEAARILLFSSVAPYGHKTSPDRNELLLVFLEPDFLACLAEDDELELSRIAPKTSNEGLSAKMPLSPPKKIHTAEPQYPSAAMMSRHEGKVVLDMAINRSGCVRRLGIASGDPLFNMEAMRAVARWRYAPVPFPVATAVTVTFHVR